MLSFRRGAVGGRLTSADVNSGQASSMLSFRLGAEGGRATATGAIHVDAGVLSSGASKPGLVVVAAAVIVVDCPPIVVSDGCSLRRVGHLGGALSSC